MKIVVLGGAGKMGCIADRDMAQARTVAETVHGRRSILSFSLRNWRSGESTPLSSVTEFL
ncbi:MAG: hypothetical protein U9R15_13545 [Chloroflexota bacterium]|nr:hypothetical protein [Chloroflexota bacterium]